MRVQRTVLGAAVAGALMSVVTSTAPAATIITTPTLSGTNGENDHAGGTGAINYTNEGTAAFAFYGNGSATPDQKAGSGNPFTALTAVNGALNTSGNNSGAPSSTSSVTFTNGTSPASVTNNYGFTFNDSGTGGFNTSTQGTVGTGLSFTYSIPANTAQTINLYAISYDAQGTLTIAADGVQQYQDLTPQALQSHNGGTAAGSGNGSGVYSFTATNLGTAADTLTFTYTLGATAGQYANVGIQGVTVANATAAVPEPASLGLLGAGALGLLARRRRRAAGR